MQIEHRKRIGSLVREARERKAYTLRELADICGINYANLSAIENGRYNVSIDILGRVCDALGCKIDITEL